MNCGETVGCDGAVGYSSLDECGLSLSAFSEFGVDDREMSSAKRNRRLWSLEIDGHGGVGTDARQRTTESET